ncbi:hypothetical protein KY285_019696 [Solanum tuberosum]|nr:hypothetical protein KY284_019698 [Solanum tuberosum]KAH0692599.1 hypothetical protein KY285_019696 [Solanum tuberosum]
MANFIKDTKNKDQDILKNLASNENDRGQARNLPLGDDLGLIIIHVPKEDQAEPKSDVQDQEHIVVNEDGNNTQNQEQPTNIPPSDDIGQEEEDEQEEQEEEENDDDNFELPNGARAKVSKPPSKRPAPPPKTG